MTDNNELLAAAKKAGAWIPDAYPSAEGGDAAWKNKMIFDTASLQRFKQEVMREIISMSFDVETEFYQRQEDIKVIALEKFRNNLIKVYYKGQDDE